MKVRYFCFRGTFLRRNSDLIRFRTKPMQYILKLNKFDPKGSLRLTMAGRNNCIVLIFKQWITKSISDPKRVSEVFRNSAAWVIFYP